MDQHCNSAGKRAFLSEMVGTVGILYLLWLVSLVSGNDGTLDGTALSQQVNCTDPQSMLAVSQKCLDAYNISFKVDSVEELANMSNPSYISQLITPAYLADMCRNVQTYQKARVCVQNTLSKCINQTQTLPSEKKIQEIMCANLDKFNITCLYEMLSKITDCSSTYTYLTTSDFINLSYAEFDHKAACMSEKLSSVCADKYLSYCGETERKIYEAVNTSNPKCQTLSSLDTPTVDCSTTTNIRRSYHQCLIYNGIPLQFPENLTSEDTSQHIMHAITMDDNMCSNLMDYQQAVKCTLHVQEQCSNDAMKHTVANSQTAQDGLAKLCGHIGDFDAKCVQNATKGTCVSRHSSLDSKHLCSGIIATKNCLVSAVSNCSKTTVSMFKSILLSQSPSMCLSQATGSLLIG